MKKYSFKNYLTVTIAILIILMIISISGCGGESSTGAIIPSPTTTITPEQIQQLEAQVNPIADTALDSISSDPNAFYTAANQIKNIQGVRAVAIDGDALSVEYNFGGVHTWVKNPPPSIPDLKIIKNSIKKLNSSDLVGNKKAIIINSTYDNDFYADFKNIVHPGIESLLKNLGYSVIYLNGAQATIESFKNLNDYGIIIVCAHGATAGFRESFGPISWSTALTEIQTGELVTQGYENWWIEHKNYFTMMTVDWGNQKIKFWAVTQRFFENYYSNRQFLSNSIFYNGSCRGMMPSTLGKSPMALALESRGVGVYLGWSDDNLSGTSGAWGLFDQMNDGDTLSKAFNDLSTGFKVSHWKDPNKPNSQEVIAYLQYYPNSSKANNIQITTEQTPTPTPTITPTPTTTPSADYFPLDTGWKWNYKQTSQNPNGTSTNTYEVTNSNGTFQNNSVVVQRWQWDNGNVTEEYFQKSTDVIWLGGKGNTDTYKYDPFRTYLKYPLSLTSWSDNFNQIELTTGKINICKGNRTILAQENVNVPAGNFTNCYKVKWDLLYTWSDNTQESLIDYRWYAPNVGEVKWTRSRSIDSWSSELTGYTKPSGQKVGDTDFKIDMKSVKEGYEPASPGNIIIRNR
jgi:hypothetical protein